MNNRNFEFISVWACPAGLAPEVGFTNIYFELNRFTDVPDVVVSRVIFYNHLVRICGTGISVSLAN